MKTTIKNFEIEFRSRFSEKKYKELLKFLNAKAEDLGTDDKQVWFYVLPDKLLKVSHNVSFKSGKITVKLTKIGKGTHFEEIEFPIAEKNVPDAVKLFNSLGYKPLIEPKILRHNYMYKGVELALKYSKSWGYHMELEVVVNSLKNKPKAEEKIFSIAKELGVNIMTEGELLAFTQNIEKNYKPGKK